LPVNASQVGASPQVLATEIEVSEIWKLTEARTPGHSLMIFMYDRRFMAYA